MTDCDCSRQLSRSNVSSSDDRLSRKLEVAIDELRVVKFVEKRQIDRGSRQSWSHQEGLVLSVGFDMGLSHWIFRVRNGAGRMGRMPRNWTPGGCIRFAVDLGSATH